MEGREDQQQKPIVGDRWRDIQGDNSWEGLLRPFNSTLKSEILRYGEFASVCYTAKSNARILANKSLFEESHKLRGCGYEIKIEDYIYANVRSSRFYLGHKSTKNVWIGFIAVCTDENEIRRLGRRDIVVAFRGTNEAGEWFQNLKDKVVRWQDLPGTNSNPDVGISKGFLGYYKDKGDNGSENSPREIIESKIAGLLETYKGQRLSITVTGHSLGGALATMSAYHMRLMWPSIPVTVFTFASPRVGNRAFADHMNEIGVKVLRVEVKGDSVTKLPGLILNENAPKPLTRLQGQKFLGQWAYWHVGRKIRLGKNLSWRTKRFHRHDIETYLDLLKKF